MLAYDITRKESFENVRKWLRYVEEFAESNVKVILVGNKCDLSEQRAVSTNAAEHLAQEFNIPWFETSAYTGEYVEDAFLTITKQIYIEAIQAEEIEREKRHSSSADIILTPKGSFDGSDEPVKENNCQC